MLWLFGIAASIVGSFGVAAGGVLQKRAHTRNDAAPAATRSRKCCGGCLCNLEWFVGFMLFAIIPIPFAMVSLALAGQSLIMPLTGVSVVMNQVLAPAVLGEKLTRVDVLATVIIVAGIAISSVFGVHSSATYTMDKLVGKHTMHRLWLIKMMNFVINMMNFPLIMMN